jgi:hypothetical protein
MLSFFPALFIGIDMSFVLQPWQLLLLILDLARERGNPLLNAPSR